MRRIMGLVMSPAAGHRGDRSGSGGGEPNCCWGLSRSVDVHSTWRLRRGASCCCMLTNYGGLLPGIGEIGVAVGRPRSCEDCGSL